MYESPYTTIDKVIPSVYGADIYDPSRVVIPTSPYDSDFQDYLNRATALGLTASVTNKSVGNALFVGLKADGIWPYLSELYIIGMFNEFSTTWPKAKYVSNPTISFVNFVSGDYSRTGGLIGNGTTKYGNSNFNPSGLLTTDDAHLSFFGSSFNTTGAAYSIGSYGASACYYLLESNAAPERMADFSLAGELPATRCSWSTGLSASGLVTVSAVSSSDFRGYQDSTEKNYNSGSRTAVMPNYNIFLYTINSDGVVGGSYSSARMQGFSAGVGIPGTQQTLFSDLIATFRAGLT